MIIKELNLKNFGKFSNQSFCFSEGINVIYGGNEAGKTTLYHGIGALLFGMEKQRGRAAKSDAYTIYQPWENKTWYEGKLRFQAGGKVFRLERNFYHMEKSVRLVCETDGEELSVEQGDLEMLLADTRAELYFNTAAVGQLKMKPQDIIYSYLKNHIASVQEEGKNATDVVKALQILENKKKALEQQKKKKAAEINEALTKLDARIELTEKEISDSLLQIDNLNNQKKQTEEECAKLRRGFFAKLFYWMKKIFCRKRLRKDENQKREEEIKLEEKIKFLQEIIGEKESQKEEFLLEKEAFYEKLHEQSKDEEVKAIELAQERMRQLSEIRKEEVLEQLFGKTSKVLGRITKGRYQKLMLDDQEELVVWDGNRALKLFQLSTGCVDQIYLAFRIGLQDMFFEEETLPLMFDDAFVYFDDKRLEKLLIYLSELHRQVFLFSCHKRELRILEKNQISYRKILL